MMNKVRQKLALWQRQLRVLWSSIRYRLGESGWSRVSWATRLRIARRGREAQVRARIERNILYLYVEIFWAGIFMAAVAFNATYALRLGASNTLIGWLSSIPSLLAMVVLVPSARFLEGRSDRSPWLRWSLVVGRGAFLAAAVVPWLFRVHTAEALVAVLVLRAIPMHFYSAGFSPMLADIIPMRDRATVMANRSIIMSATVAVCTFLFGKWMDAAAGLPWAAFPMNYQLVYIVGAVAGLLSTYFVSRIQLPETTVVRRERATTASSRPLPPASAPDDGEDRPEPPPAVRAPVSWRGLRTRLAAGVAVVAGALVAAVARWRNARQSVRRAVKENKGFVRIVVNSFVFDTGAWLVGPLYTIMFVNELGATDSWIGLNTTLAHIGVIGGNLIWRRLLERWGADRALRVSVPLAAGYALLVAAFPHLTPILLFGILINLVNPGVGLSHTNMLYGLCPPERRASYMAMYATVANVGAFLAPLIGVALSEVIDIRWLLLAGGLIRLVGAVLFQVHRVRLAPAESAG